MRRWPRLQRVGLQKVLGFQFNYSKTSVSVVESAPYPSSAFFANPVSFLRKKKNKNRKPHLSTLERGNYQGTKLITGSVETLVMI